MATNQGNGWFCTIETDAFVRDHGPFETKQEARSFASAMKRNIPKTAEVTSRVFQQKRQPQQKRQQPHAGKPFVLKQIGTPVQVKFLDGREQMRLIERFRPLMTRIGVEDIEIAKAVRTMAEAGISQTMMAEQFPGRNQTWFSWMYRLSIMPESLLWYQQNGIVKTTVLVRLVERYGVVEAERMIKLRVAELRKLDVPMRITARDLLG